MKVYMVHMFSFPQVADPSEHEEEEKEIPGGGASFVLW